VALCDPTAARWSGSSGHLMCEAYGYIFEAKRLSSAAFLVQGGRNGILRRCSNSGVVSLQSVRYSGKQLANGAAFAVACDIEGPFFNFVGQPR
jgi:hypothetical protein